MVSNRLHYVSESTTDEETGDTEYLPNSQHNKPARRPTRTPKCFSKNALMARENRLKKKMYITSLEEQVAGLKSENKKLCNAVDKQECTIDELKKEVKYLKSILANSEGIGKLIRAINSSTGMAVSTSLDKKLSITNTDLANRSPIAHQMVPDIEMGGQSNKPSFNKKFDITRHPWVESDQSSPYMTYPTPESSASSCFESPEFEELDNEGLLLDMDIPINMNNDDLLDMIDEKALETPIIPLEEHNTVKDEEDVGVCLHVSNNKVSLEFCPSCSSKALQSWRTN